MAKDTRVTFDSAASNGNNNNNGAMSPNGIAGGGSGGGGGVGFGMGQFPHHPHHLPPPPQAHHHHPHKPLGGKGGGRHSSRLTERQVSTEDAENCINEIHESFPALSTKAHRLMRQVSGSFNSRTLKVALIFSIMLNIVMGISFGVFFGMWMSWDRTSSSSPTSSSSSTLALSDNGLGGDISAGGLGIGRGHHGSYGGNTGNNNFHSRNSGKTLNGPELAAFGSKIASNADTIDAICAYCPSTPCANGPASSGSQFHHGAGNGGVGGSNVRRPGVVLSNPRGSSDCLCVDSEFYKNKLQTELKTLSAAHMMLDVHESKENSSMVWVTHDKDNICYVGRGLEYGGGKLRVLHSGQYHVYSQLTFSTIDNVMPGNRPEVLVLFSIHRKPEGKNKAAQTLLLSRLTMKPDEEENDSVSGVIQLAAGDELSVYLSHPSLLKDLRPANFFGLYKL